MENLLKIAVGLTTTASVVALGANAAQAQFTTQYPTAQMQGLNGWNTKAIFTVGETINGYTPTGILDGIGAFKINNDTVRVLVNSEINSTQGYAYNLNTKDGDIGNDVSTTGARIHYFDIDANTRTVKDAGLAFDQIFDRAGALITDVSQFPTGAGLNRFCSGQHINAGTYGFVDNIYLTGEETNGGTMFALDVDSISDSPLGGALYAASALGRGGWENVTAIDSGNDDQVALILGDDREAAPLYMYLGDKGAVGDGSFLDRNGLAQGTLYVWKADDGSTTPADFNGTGASRSGTWVEVTNFDAGQAAQPGFDGVGYATQDGLDTQSGRAAFLGNTVVPGLTDVGAFLFSRPEDVATNPNNPNQVVMASTGREDVFPEDSWGTTYTIDIDATGLTANVNILYDGDDADKQDFGLRSPDNLDWADDGDIIIQEDRSVNAFCTVSGEEASIWKLNATTGAATRIAQMDRSVVAPAGVTDPVPNDCGNWESSGILDVTSLFKTRNGEKLFILDTQAHSLRDGIIGSANLVQGGQLILASQQVPEPSVTLGLLAFGTALGVGASRRKRK
ncbi:alkaline phosphatase PhoX [Crocosphaera sp. XPORK-15E]|uniref:alkaline phosphatase PhoX n=1 Tax=Crocosphaera sp. XPORK-15E TaxID=3110247 RepID=UPI002B21663E|nr:alkaline phosphatase PhoX [Crocosphaera sp. XPORK-15E]MEA5533720.1 alkaline phosphatase PhoX [Crocosphaera sp. XPORK-15E]